MIHPLLNYCLVVQDMVAMRKGQVQFDTPQGYDERGKPLKLEFNAGCQGRYFRTTLVMR
jgi:hypothetical protein